MINTRSPRERAFLIGVLLPGTTAELIQEQMSELAELARTTGAEVVSLSNAFNVLPNVVFKVYTDASRQPELVRGVDLIGTPLSAFGRIVATGDKVDVFNGVCGAESGGVPVSASSPPLLVSEVEVQKKAQSQDPLPILMAPRPAGKS